LTKDKSEYTAVHVMRAKCVVYRKKQKDKRLNKKVKERHRKTHEDKGRREKRRGKETNMIMYNAESRKRGKKPFKKKKNSRLKVVVIKTGLINKNCGNYFFLAQNVLIWCVGFRLA